jgi:hypothetical protein
MATIFRTEDGFTLKKVGSQWTDGDLTFEDRGGKPVDHTGKRLDGDFSGGSGIRRAAAESEQKAAKRPKGMPSMKAINARDSRRDNEMWMGVRAGSTKKSGQDDALLGKKPSKKKTLEFMKRNAAEYDLNRGEQQFKASREYDEKLRNDPRYAHLSFSVHHAAHLAAGGLPGVKSGQDDCMLGVTSGKPGGHAGFGS